MSIETSPNSAQTEAFPLIELMGTAAVFGACAYSVFEARHAQIEMATIAEQAALYTKLAIIGVTGPLTFAGIVNLGERAWNKITLQR
jgi:hypothetical protein